MDGAEYRNGWGRRRRLDDREARSAAEAWRARLGVRQHVHLERISPRQVGDISGRSGLSLVGVTYDEGEARIYHTRALTLDDLVHELLHVAHPDWEEAKVVSETERLLDRRTA